jgi:hypothetical protein
MARPQCRCTGLRHGRPCRFGLLVCQRADHVPESQRGRAGFFALQRDEAEVGHAVGEFGRNAGQERVRSPRRHFRNPCLKPALALQVIEMTLPDKPRSSNQRYRLTPLGQRWLETNPGTGAG